MKMTEMLPGEHFLRRCRNDLHLDGFLGLLRNCHGLRLCLVLPEDLKIGECERFDILPGEYLVVSGRDSLNSELACLVRSASLDKFSPVAMPVRDQPHLVVGQGF